MSCCMMSGWREHWTRQGRKWLASVFRAGGLQHLVLAGVFALVVADERVLDGPILIDEEDRRARDVPRVQAHAVPDAVGLQHVAALVDQDVEGKPGFLDVVTHGLAILREHPHDLDPPGGVGVDVGGELTEPVAAVRSPRPPVEGQQQAPPRQEVRERPDPPLLVDERKPRSARERRSVHSTTYLRRWTGGASERSEPRERSEPAKRRASERVGGSGGAKPPGRGKRAERATGTERAGEAASEGAGRGGRRGEAPRGGEGSAASPGDGPRRGSGGGGGGAGG